eukprot:729364-Prymnesium_polylepis.1
MGLKTALLAIGRRGCVGCEWRRARARCLQSVGARAWKKIPPEMTPKRMYDDWSARAVGRR